MRSAKGESTMKTILVPRDGSPLSERALTYAEVIARRSRAAIVLGQAVFTSDLPYVEALVYNEAVTAEPSRLLAAHAERLHAAGLRAEWQIWNADPAHAIIEAAGSEHADMVVMATHGRSGVRR